MILSKEELKKIIYDFNSISNRLLQADFQDYTDVLYKFITHIKSTYLIFKYIEQCGSVDFDIQTVFNEVNKSHGESIFLIGDTEQEEVRNVYSVLSYIVDNKVNVCRGVALGYSISNKYQDKVKGFNERFVMVLIRHIERYLTKIGIDMGLDEKAKYSITLTNGQVNIANDNAMINATNSINIKTDQLIELIDIVKLKSKDLPPEDNETVESCLEVVKQELLEAAPRKSFIKTALSGLKGVKGTAEFIAAVIALIQYVQTIF